MKQLIYSNYFYLCLLGYPLAVVISQITNINNFSMSLFFRVVLVLISFFVIFWGLKKSYCRNLIFLFFIFCFFWLFYSFKLIYHDQHGGLNKELLEYFFWGGVCFFPSVSVFFVKNRSFFLGGQDYLALFLVVSIILLLYSSTSVVDENGVKYSNGRIQLESFNTLAFGNLASSLIIVAFTSGIKKKYFLYPIYLLGIYILIAAASRGAMVSLLSAFLFFIFAASSFSKAKLLIGALLLSIISSNFLTSAFIDRVHDVVDGTDVSVIYRFISYKGALEVFINYPFLGGAIEEPNTRYYPHNMILEIAMSMGVVGLLFFSLLILNAIRFSYFLMKNGSQYSMVPMLFIQYFVASNFSGSIVTNYTFWYLLVMVFCLRNEVK